MIETSIEEIKDLVKLERELEEKRREAENKAAEILAISRDKANRIIQEASNQEYYDVFFKTKIAELDKQKKLVEKETTEKMALIQDKTNKNREKTVTLVVGNILGE